MTLLTTPRPAVACGGCFHSVSERAPTFVSGHRMAFTITEERTVLWDQIQYRGDPSDFAWVLPVHRGAYVETSSDAWFETLDAFTTTQVVAPPLFCGGSGGGTSGCACGSASSDSAPGALGLGPNVPHDVDVVHHGTVGPYETATLHSENAGALTRWLVDHQYAVPSDMDPVIAAYVKEGWDFIALRLRPQQGISAMVPVRVITPHGPPVLPFRMVRAGVDQSVPVVLFVIADKKYTMSDLVEVSTHDENLIYDWGQKTSNYGELRDAALARNDGLSFLTTFASGTAFAEPISVPNGGTALFSPKPTGNTTADSGQVSRLPELYFEQFRSDGKGAIADDCFAEVRATSSTSVLVETTGPGDGTPDSSTSSSPSVSDGSVEGSASEASSDGGPTGDSLESAFDSATHNAGDGSPESSLLDQVTSDHAQGAPPDSTASSRSPLTCGDADDLSAALIGLRPASAWLTRLEMTLPLRALSADCEMKVDSAQEPIANWHTAHYHRNPPCQPVQGDTVVADGSSATSPSIGLAAIAPQSARSTGLPRGAWWLGASSSLMAIFVWRRARRRC